jgi:hypothetical protein
MAPNTMSGYPQIEVGMMLATVNGDEVFGMSNEDALALVKEAGRCAYPLAAPCRPYAV